MFILNKCGEGGIRTLDTSLEVYSLSRGALSATQPPLRFLKGNKYSDLSGLIATFLELYSERFFLVVFYEIANPSLGNRRVKVEPVPTLDLTCISPL